jgi:hypothetical protein
MKATFIKTAAAVAALVLSAGAAQANTIATDATYGVFDSSQGTRLLHIARHGTITDLNITIDFAKCGLVAAGPADTACPNAASAFENEINFALVSPNGTTVQLIPISSFGAARGGIGRVGVTFDDEASSALGIQVQAGSFRPGGLLSTFDGMDMFGDWSLFIRDNNNRDPLSYFSSRLDVSTVAADVPEPATAAIFGLGMLGIGAARRRARR